MPALWYSERREANLKDLQLCDLRDGLILHLIIASGEDEDVVGSISRCTLRRFYEGW
jgi:hypothetical protein